MADFFATDNGVDVQYADIAVEAKRHHLDRNLDVLNLANIKAVQRITLCMDSGRTRMLEALVWRFIV